MRTMKSGKNLLLGLGSLIFALLLIGPRAQANAKLPKAYQGTWYGYAYANRVNHVKTYYVIQLKITNNQLDYNFLKTTKPDLSGLVWQWGERTRVTYSKNYRKHKQLGYHFDASAFNSLDVNKMQLSQVKVAGQNETRLKFWGGGGFPVSAFRQPINSSDWAWGDDYEDMIPTDE